MKDYYIVLTGAIDNAGDFLIRDRALKLLKRYRPDREIVECPRREPVTDERLEIVNQARALLLAGGPSIQPNLYPGIFPLTDLSRIHVPIILYGAGWKGGGGSWQHENYYRMSESSQQLVQKFASTFENHSVRDYHTFIILKRHGLEQVRVTGCPALYGSWADGGDGVSFMLPEKLTRIAVSAGVKFVYDKRLEDQLISLLQRLQSNFEDLNELTLVFHHSIDQNKRQEAYGSSRPDFTEAHQRLAERLRSESPVEIVEVGSDLDKMMATYNDADLHVGYRVHAHAYMSSIGKPSFLLAEDGRGTGMGQLTGPERTVVAVEARALSPGNRVARILNRGLSRRRPNVNQRAVDATIDLIDIELREGWQLSQLATRQLSDRFRTMQSFLRELP